MASLSEDERNRSIIHLANQLQGLLDVPATRHEMDQIIQVHFAALSERSEGEITDEMLAIADQLYDLPVVKSLAKALNVSVGTLRYLLGRKITRPCSRCGVTIEAVEKRIKGGYQPIEDSRFCKSCQETMAAERSRGRAIQYEKEQQETEHRQRMAWFLLSSPLKQVVFLPEVKERLLSYGRLWANEREYGLLYDQAQTLTSCAFGKGCMLCGAEEVKLYLTNQNWIPPNSLSAQLKAFLLQDESERQRSSGDSPSLEQFPIRTVVQVLWYTWPKVYFVQAALIPILLRPLIMICQKDAYLTTETHFDPYPEETFV